MPHFGWVHWLLLAIHNIYINRIGQPVVDLKVIKIIKNYSSSYSDEKGWIDNDNKDNIEELHCKLHCDHTVEILPWYIWSLRAASKYLSPIINKVCYELDLLQKPAPA